MTGPLVLFSGVTNTDPTQLVAPSLAASPPTDSLTVRSVVIATSGPASWPGGVLVQFQTSPDNSVWTNGASSASGTTLNLTRTGSATTTFVRGFAINGGALTDSGASGVVVIAVPAALTAVTAGGTPLAFRVRVFPKTATTSTEAGTPIGQPLPLAATGSNRIVLDQIADPEVPTRISASSTTWRALTSAGVVLGSGAMSAGASGEWRVTLLPSPQMRVLELSVTAPDASVTAVQYPVVLIP